MSYIQPDGGNIVLPLSGLAQEILTGDPVPLPMVADDEVVIVGPDGRTTKVGVTAIADRRVLVEQDDGLWIEVRALSTAPVSSADAAGRVAMFNSVGQLADWMIPAGLVRRYLAHLIADGILDTFTFQHNLGTPLPQIAMADSVTWSRVDPADYDPLPDPLDASNKTILTFAVVPVAGVYLVSFIG